MSLYICDVCEQRYDEEKERVKWGDLPEDWRCPVCESPKSFFKISDEVPDSAANRDLPENANAASEHDFTRTGDEFETYMADIHAIAQTGKSVKEPMNPRKPEFSWDQILIKGAQLARIPLNVETAVNTRTIIGPKADKPLEIEIPVYVSHMSFGALSKEVKIALAKGSAALKTAMCSGEGGILPESIQAAYKYIFEYVPNQYSVTGENLRKADAIEIKFGQSAKPGMGGHLPAIKVTEEIAAIRGFKTGKDISSPACYPDIRNADDLKKKIDWLREKSAGRPIGIKLAAGHIEEDIEIALYAGIDFLTIDGRGGGTGSAPKFIKASTSIPTIFALHRARKFLEVKEAKDVSLIITGGLRISSDFAKALALGADAVAIASAALMACGCQQYRICHTGKCPRGIATQDTELRARFDIESASRGLTNFLRVSTEELESFARLTGKSNVHDLSVSDLSTVNSEIEKYTTIEHV